MISNFLWIFLLILQCGLVTPRSTLSHRDLDGSTYQQHDYEALNKPNDESGSDEQVISVRITSSVAVGRGKPKTFYKKSENNNQDIREFAQNRASTELPDTTITTKNYAETVMTEIPPNLVGANIEFIRQLNAKKEAKNHFNFSQVNHSLVSNTNQNDTPKIDDINDEKETILSQIPATAFEDPPHQYNQEEDSLAEPSNKAVLEIEDKSYNYENIGSLPLAGTILRLPSNNQVNKINERGPNFSQMTVMNQGPDIKNNDTEDTVAASSIQSISTVRNVNERDENIENVPLARSLPFTPSSKNYIQGLTNKPPGERGNNPSLTTVSFNIVHDTPKQSADFNAQRNINEGNDSSNKFYEPPKVYSQPAKVYSEPAKFYSEPAKIYSEPAKIYSEPAKVYSEPAKIYSEPAKFYSPQASLHLTPDVVPNNTPWQDSTERLDITSTFITTSTPLNTVPPEASIMQGILRQQPERNYEVDEKLSVLTDGRSHGVQETSTEKCKQDNCKVGYVVEGRQYKKYRVEERTPDGFIVGEYGVVRNEDGALRGVRYTADSDASPRLIYDALMKFLQLK